MTDVFTKYSVAVPTQDQLCGSYTYGWEVSHYVAGNGQFKWFNRTPHAFAYLPNL